MMNPQLPLGCLFGVLAGLATTGCLIAPDDEVSVPEEVALKPDALTSNALTSNALTSNALTSNALTDPNARELLTYIVSCALPAGQQVSYVSEGTSYTLSGSLGLAPQWGEADGSCDESCQQWVSACVLSRVDYLGAPLSISVRGQNPGLVTGPAEQAQYTHREAAYYGNVFSQPQQFFGCISPGLVTDPRVCGPGPLYQCFIHFAGTCKQVCDPALSDGSFPNCRAPVPGEGQGFTGPIYHESVTVFLH